MAGNASGIRAGKAYYELGINESPLVKGLQNSEGDVKESLSSVASLRKKMADADAQYQEKRAAKAIDRAKEHLSSGGKSGGQDSNRGLIKSMVGGVRGAFGALGEQLKKVLTSPITALVAALAPLAAGKLFAGMASELTDVARRTGASTSALQSLGYAAKRTGADMGAVEGALTTVRDKIIDAVRGNEDAQLSFRKLGLNFLELSKMSPEQQLRKIAAALNAIPHPAIRAAMATELLGSTDLLPMLQDLDKAEARYKRLGLVLGTDVISAGKKLSNSFEDLHANMMATVSVIGAKISPAISDLIDKWVEMSGHTRAWIADNTAMFGSAEALWAFLKLQWAKGSAFILEQFGMAGRGMESLWVDTQAALEAGWERFKHGAGHAFSWVADVAANVFKEIAKIGMDTFAALSSMFAYISDDMAAAMNNAANAMARMMKKLSLRDAGAAIADLTKKALDQDNEALQHRLQAIDNRRQRKHDEIKAQGGPDQALKIAALEKEYREALANAEKNKPKPPGEGEAGGHGRGMGGDRQAGFDAAKMHLEGIGAVDVKTKEGFASVAASLRQSQLAQQSFTLQQQQYQVERDMRDRIVKITVVGRK